MPAQSLVAAAPDEEEEDEEDDGETGDADKDEHADDDKSESKEEGGKWGFSVPRDLAASTFFRSVPVLLAFSRDSRYSSWPRRFGKRSWK